MMGDTFRFLHAIEKDGIDLKDRGIYLAENAAMAAKLAKIHVRERFQEFEERGWE